MSNRVKELYEFGPFRLDPAEHTLLREGQPIPLRPKVFDILLVLVENHGHLVEKEALMNSVWTEQFVEEGNINKNISMLRRALCEGENGQQFIETVPKRGYRFIADVRKVNADETTELAPQTQAPAVVETIPQHSKDAERSYEYPTSATHVRTSSRRNWIPVPCHTSAAGRGAGLCGFHARATSVGNS